MGWPVIHGKKNTRVYRIWADMIQRCTNPARDNYINYGSRGISVCPEWMNFKNFYADMGDVPDGMTIERNDVNGNYEKSNCRWASNAEQMLNRTCSRFVVVDGEKMVVAVASRRYGISENLLRWRLNRGWSDDQSVKTPVRAMAKRCDWRRRCV